MEQDVVTESRYIATVSLTNEPAHRWALWLFSPPRDALVGIFDDRKLAYAAMRELIQEISGKEVQFD